MHALGPVQAFLGASSSFSTPLFRLDRQRYPRFSLPSPYSALMQDVIELETAHPQLPALCPTDALTHDPLCLQHPHYAALLRCKAPMVFHMLSSVVGHDRTLPALRKLLAVSVAALTSAGSDGGQAGALLFSGDGGSPSKALHRDDSMALDSPPPLLIRSESDGGDGEVHTRSLVGGLSTQTYLQVMADVAKGDAASLVDNFSKQV
jgi:hypothetical protein